MANLSKIKREKMLDYLEKLKEINNDDENIRAITEIENALNEKKYGLVWEEHSEKVDEELVHNIPIFVEDENRKITVNKDEPYNFLLEGDNLHSLKLLEKTHKGKIDVIYIDPPYNTGNKDFIYDDSFVDKTDGYAHSKWLSFMEKRLIIASKLLSDDGVIFTSIDEAEYAQIKLLYDKIFGETNYVENFIWIKNSTKNLSKTTSTNHEYILCYSKNIEKLASKEKFRQKKEGYYEVLEFVDECRHKNLSVEESQKKLRQLYKVNSHWKGISNYNFIDENWEVYTSSDCSAPKSTGIGNVYDIIHPITKKVCKIPVRGWAYTKETMNEHLKNNLILFGEDETNVPRFKRLLKTVQTEVKKSIISDFTDGKKELQKIFGESPFDNPKPTTLIINLLSTFSNNATIIDFFAGSGTTGHAVMQLNKEDGGHRKYILCTNNENNICEEVTYQRLKNIQEDLPHNLKYYKTDFIPKFSDEEDSISDKMMEHIKELIELEYHIELDGKRYLILEDEDKLSETIEKIENNGSLFVRSGIFLSRSDQRMLDEKQVNVVEIPEYYFRDELKEVGEL